MRRRDFLKAASLAGLCLTFPPLAVSAAREPDVEIELRAAPGLARIMDGPPTNVWRYTGTVLAGDEAALSQSPGGWLGPTLRLKTGQRVRIHFVNDLPEPSIVHWHGLHVQAQMDGHPRYAVDGGQRFTYEFTVLNRPGAYWYHPHPHGRTGPQVYGGLAGLLVVDEPEPRTDLPGGENELLLAIQDRSFSQDNQLIYLRHPMERMTGFLGERILVNGRPEAEFEVRERPYRVRILNASNARIYNLAFSDGRPLTVLGGDGGLLDKPREYPSLLLGTGERLDLWVDFSRVPKGRRLELLSLPFEAGGGPAGGFNGIPQGLGFRVADFSILDARNDDNDGTEPLPLPETLSDFVAPGAPQAVNIGSPRTFEFAMNHMRGTINGRVFIPDEVADWERVELGSREIWEFTNPGGMPPLPHPVHVHGQPFVILERSGPDYGLHMDAGFKDTTLLMPGQKMRALMSFDDYAGLFLYHCHNLEHEDMGMMRNYRIVDPSRTGD